jgi:hypothetical protein
MVAAINAFAELAKEALFPVIVDAEEYDLENDIECKLHLPAYEQRAELIKEAKLIIWDEISSLHMKYVNAVLKATDYFKGKVVLFIGDGLQITPVVKYGSKEEISSNILMYSTCSGSASPRCSLRFLVNLNT